MTRARHTMILASAGSGKTYALTNRFVQLLAQGAAPERIVALTFTRKAAGEFFDEILQKLAQAATDEPTARRLAEAIGAPALRSADFLKLLRAMIDAMPRLNLGTLDGFFARIVRGFPLELGLGGTFEILQEHSARRERRRVLRSLFVAAGEPDPRQREFIEAFKRATFGVEEKQLSRRLDAFLDGHAETFLAAPVAAVWGEPQRIWPDGSPWLAAAESRESAVKALRAALPWPTLGDRQRERFEAFFAELAEWSAGAPLPPAVAYLLKNVFAVWEDLAKGAVEVTVERKKVALRGEAARAMLAVVAAIAGEELRRRLEMTRGLFSVLRGYETVYHDAVRRGGRLTFADVQRLLLPEAGGPRLGSGPGGDDGDRELRRLAIDWRLDARFDHWLLDEFQDTSYGQWSVLRNLIDEAVQDADGTRSFFYVGDVKQAIFAWREGDPALFREIFSHYNRSAPGTIAEVHLTQSWRSGPAVIGMVNRVFGDQQALARVVPAGTAAVWAREWQDHTTAHATLDGCAELRLAEEEAGRFEETLRILQEVQPLQRGLSVAVLVQKNDTGARLADFLRRAGGWPAVAESDLHVCTDNPLSAGLLALLRAAAHPGDSLAWEHVRMTPIAAVLMGEGRATPEALTRTLLKELQAVGFAATLEHWLNQLEPHLRADDAFSRARGRQLVEAAEVFDESGSREVAEFLEFAERHTVRDAETSAVVRVLTVHKSKGLGFDVVILPDLEGRSLTERRRGLAVKKSDDRAVEWVLDLPIQMLAQHDPVLGRYLEDAAAEAGYESLCRLYVAMTRAKRAMYLVTEPVGDSHARNFPQLLRSTLGESYREGNPDWYKSLEVKNRTAESVVVPEPPGSSEAWVAARRWPARTPSGSERATVSGAAAFALETQGRADFGRIVHALMATVEWWSPEQGAWSPPAEFATEHAAVAQVRACLHHPALAPVFARPAGGAGAEVWRERAFEIVLDGEWITGVFDRVVLALREDGSVASAQVWDFKTDRLETAAAAEAAAVRYAPQLQLYRRVAARLAGLSEAAVHAALVFTAHGQIVGN